MALHVLYGTSDPASAPTQLGQQYVNTTTDKHFVSVGVSSVNDWQAQVGGDLIHNVEYIIDGGGSTITTGEKPSFSLDFTGTIVQAKMFSNQTGSIVLDLWKSNFADFPPDNSDSITASAPPTITASRKSLDSTLTGWTTSVTAGDIFIVNVDSVTSIQAVTLVLKVLRS